MPTLTLLDATPSTDSEPPRQLHVNLDLVAYVAPRQRTAELFFTDRSSTFIELSSLPAFASFVRIDHSDIHAPGYILVNPAALQSILAYRDPNEACTLKILGDANPFGVLVNAPTSSVVARFN